MILRKQLKQLTLSATRKNAHLPRLYTSPAVSQSLATSKPSKRLSRDDRRLLVESFVTKYRAANAGKFPGLKFTIKEVGGGYYVVRDILQELKLRPNAPISRVPNDASSLKQDHTTESSHSSSDDVSIKGDNNLFITATHDTSETATASLGKDVDSKCDGSPPESQTLKVAEECIKNSETEEEATLDHLSSQEPRADHLQGANLSTNETRDQYNPTTTAATHGKRETETYPSSKDVDSKCDSDAQLPENQTLKVADECLKNSEAKDEGTLTQFVSPEPKAEGANVLPAKETETAPPNDDAVSKCDATTLLPGSQNSKVTEECIKNSETEKEGILTHLGSRQETKEEDCHEGGAASSDVLPTETRQVPEKGDGEVKTGENSSAWSNIISFAKGFANFWRKG